VRRCRSHPAHALIYDRTAADPFHPVEGGSANDYDYVEGDPINSLDLDGRCKCGTYRVKEMKNMSWRVVRRRQVAIPSEHKTLLWGALYRRRVTVRRVILVSSWKQGSRRFFASRSALQVETRWELETHPSGRPSDFWTPRGTTYTYKDMSGVRVDWFEESQSRTTMYSLSPRCPG
jgi:hypothetical protein